MSEDYESGWQDGYNVAMTDADETVEEKDSFIAHQTGIIIDLMKVVDTYNAWGGVPEELIEKLRSYV